MIEKFDQFWKLLQASKNILLINHIRMDPDAFWSLAGLYFVLKDMWYNVAAINDEYTPKEFGFLWANEIIQPNLDIKKFNPDLIISLDAASLWQLWDTYIQNNELFDSTDFIVFDHHKTNPGFWSLNIIDVESSSTCELVFRALEHLWLQKHINTHIATLITAGIHTDTNIFYNENTTPTTLRVAAKLMEFWADFRSPMFEFYKKKTFNRTKLWWEILKDIQQDSEWKITYALVEKEVFKKTDTNNWDTTGITNEFLANMEDSEVCFMLYPIWWWKIKWSLRSKSIDVSSVCAQFGWGGHKLAAWFSTDLPMEEISKLLLEKLRKLL